MRRENELGTKTFVNENGSSGGGEGREERCVRVCYDDSSYILIR